jgi:hypothetical protein
MYLMRVIEQVYLVFLLYPERGGATANGTGIGRVHISAIVGSAEKSVRFGIGLPIPTHDAVVLLNAPWFLRKRDLNVFWRYAKRRGKLLPYLDCVEVFFQDVPAVIVLDVPRRYKKDVLRVILVVFAFLKTGLDFLPVKTQPVNVGFRQY